MKFNKKLVVATLSSALGLGIVGSITGTVAWYQYSTRSTAAFIGTSVKATANLEMSLDNGAHYYNDLSSSQVATALTSKPCKDGTVAPITVGQAQAKNAALPANFKTNPVYRDFEYSKWENAKATEYVQFDLKLRYTGNGETDPIEGKKIYLNDFEIKEREVANKLNISDAVRVHLASTNNMLLSNNAQSTTLGGYLDLNRDGKDDDNVKWEWQTGTAQKYGNDTFVEQSYKLSEVQPTNTNGVLSGGQYLGVTAADGTLNVTVTIWLEGWQELYNTVGGLTVGTSSVKGYYTKDAQGAYTEITDDEAKAEENVTYYDKSADWSESNYLNSQFYVGFEFIVERA